MELGYDKLNVMKKIKMTSFIVVIMLRYTIIDHTIKIDLACVLFAMLSLASQTVKVSYDKRDLISTECQ